VSGAFAAISAIGRKSTADYFGYLTSSSSTWFSPCGVV
jgi:hypothetical protein